MSNVLEAILTMDSAGFNAALAKAGTAVKTFEKSTAGFGAGMDAGMATTEAKLATFGTKWTAAGKTLTKGLTVPIIAVGTAMVLSAEEVDKGQRIIAQRTGETGALLNATFNSAKKVFANVPESMTEVAGAISLIKQRTGEAGKPLQDFTTQIVNLAHIGKANITDLANSVTAAFKNWNISTANQSSSLDYLYKVTAKSGIPIQSLTDAMIRGQAPMTQMGLDFKQSGAFLGLLAEHGITGSRAMMGLVTGSKNVSKEFPNSSHALGDFIDKIKAAGPSTASYNEVVKAFGTRIGPVLYQMIMQGKLGINDFVAALDASKSSINKTADNTRSLVDVFKIVGHQLAIAIEPMGKDIINAAKAAVPAMKDIIGVIKTLIDWFTKMPGFVKVAALGFMVFGAALGPVISIVGHFATAISGMIKVVGGIKDMITKVIGFFTKTGEAATTSAEEIDTAGGAAATGGEEFEAAGQTAAMGGMGFSDEAIAATTAATDIDTAGGTATAGGAEFETAGQTAAMGGMGFSEVATAATTAAGEIDTAGGAADTGGAEFAASGATAAGGAAGFETEAAAAEAAAAEIDTAGLAAETGGGEFATAGATAAGGAGGFEAAGAGAAAGGEAMAGAGVAAEAGAGGLAALGATAIPLAPALLAVAAAGITTGVVTDKLWHHFDNAHNAAVGATDAANKTADTYNTLAAKTDSLTKGTQAYNDAQANQLAAAQGIVDTAGKQYGVYDQTGKLIGADTDRLKMNADAMAHASQAQRTFDYGLVTHNVNMALGTKEYTNSTNEVNKYQKQIEATRKAQQDGTITTDEATAAYGRERAGLIDAQRAQAEALAGIVLAVDDYSKKIATKGLAATTKTDTANMISLLSSKVPEVNAQGNRMMQALITAEEVAHPKIADQLQSIMGDMAAKIQAVPFGSLTTAKMAEILNSEIIAHPQCADEIKAMASAMGINLSSFDAGGIANAKMAALEARLRNSTAPNDMAKIAGEVQAAWNNMTLEDKRSNIVLVGAADAIQAAHAVANAIKAIPSHHSGGSVLHAGGSVFHSGGALLERFDYGGLKSNEVISTLLRGEYVMQNSAVDKYGVAFMDAINRGILPKNPITNNTSGDTYVNMTLPNVSTAKDAKEIMKVINDLSSGAAHLQRVMS